VGPSRQEQPQQIDFDLLGLPALYIVDELEAITSNSR